MPLWDDATAPFTGQPQQPPDPSSMWGRLSSLVQSGQPGQQPVLISGVPSAASAGEVLTPQEQNLVEHHLDNLYGPGKVISPSGNVSTVLQAVTTRRPDGSRYYNIPTVWDGKVLTVDEAAERAAKAGWDKWPSYATPEQADLRYEWMHDLMAKDTGAYRAAGGAPSLLALK
jgi:hypothetical protein